MSYPKPESCRTCVGWAWGHDGFMPDPEGDGSYGVLFVGEALGEDEAAAGRPFVGRAGWNLTQMLQRAGLERRRFIIDNCLRCRPPNNKLEGQPYAHAALMSCARYLDSTIQRVSPRVIVCLGATALRRVLDLPPSERLSAWRGYVEWSARYQCWVITTWHPSYLMRGNQHLTGVWITDVQRAVDIARDGYAYHDGTYLLDPSPARFKEWCAAYRDALTRDPALRLTYDVETPFKQDLGEDELRPQKGADLRIIRIGFSCDDHAAVSIPWEAPYLSDVRQIMGSPGIKVAYYKHFDRTRLISNDVAIGGEEWDAMDAFHLVNSDVPKRLQFAAPLIVPEQRRWKHLNATNPALYNAIDARVEHWMMTRLLERMTAQGVVCWSR